MFADIPQPVSRSATSPLSVFRHFHQLSLVLRLCCRFIIGVHGGEMCDVGTVGSKRPNWTRSSSGHAFSDPGITVYNNHTGYYWWFAETKQIAFTKIHELQCRWTPQIFFHVRVIYYFGMINVATRWVTINGVWIGNWIYWTVSQLVSTLNRSLPHTD
jgi:hypothetical protein